MNAAKFAGALGASVVIAFSLGLGAARAQAAGPGPEARHAEAPMATPRAPVSDDVLAGLSGGDGGVAVAVSNQRLEAVNSGNRVIADNVTTGSVSLDHGALSGFNGLGNVVINTGNNNNLQSSLSVSIVTPR